jgi:hypothetical protein
MGWQLDVLTTSPHLSVEWLRRGSNRRRSRVEMVGKLTQVVTDSAHVLGSRFDLQRPPHVVVRDTVRRQPPDLAQHRAEIDQATGMVSEQLGVAVAEAFVRLRAYAYVQDRRLSDVARDIVARRLRLSPDPRQGP